MITKVDGVELVGRAFKIPKEGITFKNLKGERFNIFPAETKGRIFNHSKNKDFYIFAAGFGTFIIPALFGLDALLKSFNFKKVSDDILPVRLTSNHMPLYTKDQTEWYHMINVIGQLNASTAHTLLRLERWDLGIFDFLTLHPKSHLLAFMTRKLTGCSIRWQVLNFHILIKVKWENLIQTMRTTCC